MMKFTFLGTSSGVPTRTRNVTGLAVQPFGTRDWLLVDCGEGTQHRLLNTPLSLQQLHTICITHAHGDHCYGLPGLLESAGMGGRQAPLTLIAPACIFDWLRATRAMTDAQLPYPLIELPLEGCAECVLDAPAGDGQQLRITRHALAHRVPSHAFRIASTHTQVRLRTAKLRALGLPAGPLWGALQRGEAVEHAGQTLQPADWCDTVQTTLAAVIGGDNAQAALLTEACAGAQLLVHEATFTREMLAKVGPGPMHSAAGDVAAFAQAIGLPNLILTHFSARLDADDGLQALRTEVDAAYRGQVWLAHDGAQFTLGDDGQVTLEQAS